MCFKKGEENILGTELVPCSLDPLTAFYRDGFCKTFDNFLLLFLKWEVGIFDHSDLRYLLFAKFLS